MSKKGYTPKFMEVNPSNVESATSGGTADVLPKERAKATFDVQSLTHFLDGGPEKTKRRRFILSPTEGQNLIDKYLLTRTEMLREHVKHFSDVHKDYWDSFVPTREDASWMQENAVFSGAFMNHYGLFLPTLLAQADAEQKAWWLFPALQLKIWGCYAQTELGHGSNVRGLMTTAIYDKTKQEFVLNTPTLRSIKWWPGALGKVGTHAIVYAQLMLDGKEYGVHAFMLQIRDENHKPFPGIELGDLGPKLGDHSNDTGTYINIISYSKGYMVLRDVRIPREYMLAAHQQVTPEGQYVKSEKKKKNDKLHYATMIFTRGYMVKAAGGYLARAATIAIRYSCVRTQGFENTKTTSHKSPEKQIIDHQVQRYRILKQLALTYAMKFTGKWMIDLMATIDGGVKGSMEFQNLEALPFLAATSAGLKALCTVIAWQGIEDCRKACGGNGYLLNSGIAALAADYLWQSTAEGDWVVLMLQSASFLMKSLEGLRNGNSLTGPMEYLTPLKNDIDLRSVAPRSVDFNNLDVLVDWFKYASLAAVAHADSSLKSKLAIQSRTEAWNNSALDLLTAVRAHCYYFLISNFVDVLKKSTDLDSSLRKVLEQLCALFGCSTIVDEPHFNGLFDIKQLQLVKKNISKLLDDLRPNAVALVDAFDIPDRVLNSTIGRYDGNVYEALYNAVKKNPLNLSDPFEGYDSIRQYLDLELLKKHNSKL